MTRSYTYIQSSSYKCAQGHALDFIHWKVLVKKCYIQNLYFIYLCLLIRLANKPVSNYENSYLATRLRKKDIWNEFLINESQCDFFRLIDLIRLHPHGLGAGDIWHLRIIDWFAVKACLFSVNSQWKLTYYRQGHRCSCPVRKRSLPFLRQKNFDLSLIAFPLKRKTIANLGRTLTFRILISLPYHYTTTPIRQKSENIKYMQ